EVGEGEREVRGGADRVDQGLGTLDQVPERRPVAGARERLLQAAHELRRLDQELVNQVREVGEEVDQELERLGDELPQVEAVELERREVGEVLRGRLQGAEHLGRRDAAGEGRGQERAGGETDVDVEVGGLAVDEEVVERLQTAELVGAAGDRPTGEDKSDARVLPPRREIALVNDGEAHGPLWPESVARFGRRLSGRWPLPGKVS